MAVILKKKESKMGDGRRASGRTKVDLPDGRTIIVVDGDLIPAGGKIVGKSETPVNDPQVRTAAVKSPKAQKAKPKPKPRRNTK